jgi:hypothetical protein
MCVSCTMPHEEWTLVQGPLLVCRVPGQCQIHRCRRSSGPLYAWYQINARFNSQFCVEGIHILLCTIVDIWSQNYAHHMPATLDTSSPKAIPNLPPASMREQNSLYASRSSLSSFSSAAVRGGNSCALALTDRLCSRHRHRCSEMPVRGLTWCFWFRNALICRGKCTKDGVGIVAI